MRARLPLMLAGTLAASATAAVAAPGAGDLEARPLLKRYCYECHGDGATSGDLAMDGFKSVVDVRKAKDTWAKVISYARSQTMPPPDAERQPSQDERDQLVASLVRQVYDIDPRRPDPGPMVVRRLNQVEYHNSIHDLTGVSYDTALEFPQDDTSYGFDNIGDVLTVPPMLMEKYLRAADRIMNEAIPVGDDSKKPTEPMRALLAKYGVRATTRPATRQVRDDHAVARNILGDFARRAWRRPVRTEEVDRLVALYGVARRDGEGFVGGVRHAMKGVLCSPNFVFRGVTEGPAGPTNRQVGEFELASRLSYFLWSSTPDDELLDLAERGKLRINLAAQVRRMVASPKSKALVDNFFGQWLQFRNLDAVHPDDEQFKDFDGRIRDDMRRETEMFVDAMVHEDRNPIELLTADYTFVNGRLGKYYGIAGVDGKEFRRVSLAGTKRRGILTQGSILTLTSNPTRTSPVKRGKWVLENLLGAAPPAPPPNLPALDGDHRHPLTGTLRQRMEKHRADPACAACHAPMDPIGFSLENFDAVGRWRETDGGQPVDASSSFPGGAKFTGPIELTDLLARTRRNDFYRAMTEAAMTFALGRGVEPTDQPAVDRIVADLRKPDARFSTVLMGVIDSVPFQMRRGDLTVGSAPADGRMAARTEGKQ